MTGSTQKADTHGILDGPSIASFVISQRGVVVEVQMLVVEHIPRATVTVGHARTAVERSTAHGWNPSGNQLSNEGRSEDLAPVGGIPAR